MKLNISPKDETWVKKHKPVKTWLERLSPTTHTAYANALHNFFLWLEEQGGLRWTDDEDNERIAVTPEELLEAQDELYNRKRKERYLILDLVQEYVRESNGRRYSKKTKYYQIRSFFQHNRVPLPKDDSFIIHAEVPPVDSPLNLENFRHLILTANETYQAIFLIMFQGAMGSKEFLYFNENSWDQIQPQLERGKDIIKIDLPGRKHSRFEKPYYTFIGRDAIDALKRYLSKRGKISNGEHIFLNQRKTSVKYDSLKRYFRHHAFKIGIVERETIDCPKCGGKTRRERVRHGTPFNLEHGSRAKYICNECEHVTPSSDETYEQLKTARYGLGVHELRDLFRSTWEQTPCKGVVAEFLMGHDVDPNNYNKFYKTNPNWVEQQYQRAVSWLNIMSEDPTKIPVDEVSKLTDKTEEQDGKIEEQNEIIARQQKEIENLRRQLENQEGRILDIVKTYLTEEIGIHMDDSGKMTRPVNSMKLKSEKNK